MDSQQRDIFSANPVPNISGKSITFSVNGQGQTGELRFMVQDGTNPQFNMLSGSTNVITAGTWHHVAATCSGEALARKGGRRVDSIELGQKYRDTVTGLEGVATARIEYLAGQPRVMLESRCEGKIREHWFEHERLERVVAEDSPE